MFTEDQGVGKIPRRMSLCIDSVDTHKGRFHTDTWNERTISDMQMTTNLSDCPAAQLSEKTKVDEKNSHKNLEDYYVTCPTRSNVNSEEKPLDFSKKVVKADKVSRSESTACMNGEKNSDSINTSTNNQVGGAYSMNNTRGGGVKIPMKRDISPSLQNNTHERGAKTPRMRDSSPSIQNNTHELGARIPWQSDMSPSQKIAMFCKDQAKRSQLEATNFLGSEVDHHYQHSVSRSISFKGITPPYCELEKLELPVDVRNQSSLHTISKTPHVSKDYPKNSSECLTGKNDSFSISDILSPPTTKKVEHTQKTRELSDSLTQPDKSPQSTFSNFCSDEKRPPGIISPNQPLYESFNKFSVGSGGRPHDINGIHPAWFPMALPVTPFSNFVHHTPPGGICYDRFRPYLPDTLLPKRIDPMYGHSYQQALHASQEKQRTKDQRPFKSIDIHKVLSDMPVIKNPHLLQELHLTMCSESTTLPAANSSPQRLSPDSPCVANSSSCNSNEASEDINGEPERKKVRRVPPEEKDEKYLEKRRKNNLAAKRSRDVRKKKEDGLAISVQFYTNWCSKLQTELELLIETLKKKEMELDRIKANLITFREKCDGKTKELFDEIFRFCFPQL